MTNNLVKEAMIVCYFICAHEYFWDALLRSSWSAPPYCLPALSSIFLHPVTPSDTRKRLHHSAESPVIPGQIEAAMLPSCAPSVLPLSCQVCGRNAFHCHLSASLPHPRSLSLETSLLSLSFFIFWGPC